ncbi:MAG: M48 family metallopeptidase [Betaproteobacteria bacterium]|nr:M48 family metallopeptidase [Betaproteobacteria bacterium]
MTVGGILLGLVRRWLLTTLCLVAFAPCGAAESLPDLGEASETVISAVQERRLGESIMRQIRASPAYLGDLEINGYLNGIGYRLAYQSQDHRFPFEFFGVDDARVNAFALPGGFIGVHTGLILTAQSESELAAVLGHEVAHVSQRHLARIIAAQQKAQIASLAAIALAILAAQASPDLAQAAVAGAQYAAVQTQINFTREHEREADRIGIQLLEKAGFDARAMPAFFDRLQRATRIYDNNAPTYARTHPLTYERIADVEGRVEALPYRQVPDSLDFLLLRTKLHVQQLGARDAISNYGSQLKDKRYNSEAAVRYGLVSALLAGKRADAAAAELPALLSAAQHHPVADSLAGRVLNATPQPKAALTFYEAAHQRHPTYPALTVDYARLLLHQKQPGQALKLINKLLATGVSAPTFHFTQAECYAALGKSLQQHRAQAEGYFLEGRIGAAIEQLEIGLRSGERDFYEMSGAEARLREFKALDAEAKRK